MCFFYAILFDCTFLGHKVSGHKLIGDMLPKVFKVLRMGNPVLRKKAKEVDYEEIQTTKVQSFIDILVNTMRSEIGVGIAAPQVGKSVRIFVMECQNNERYTGKDGFPMTVAINPTIEPTSEDQIENWEGCLSIPGIRGSVPRYSQVKLKALDRFGESFEKDLQGFEAVVAQHELDHLNGILFIDRLIDTKKLAFYEEYLEFETQ
ncbi:MAG: peptide deformylase [Arcticibacterium sp.]